MSHSSLPAAELFRLCMKGDGAAWDEFLHRYNRIIYGTLFQVLRTLLPVDLIQQEYQQFLMRLVDRRILLKYREQEGVEAEAWLRRVAQNYALDQRRVLKRHADGPDGTPRRAVSEEPALADGADGSRTRIETGIVMNECEAYLTQALPEDTRQRDLLVFTKYYREGVTAKDIGQLPAVGLTTEGVESVLQRICKLLVKWTKRNKEGFAP